MRYVMIWFTCSVKDCDVKAERMVRARMSHSDSRASIVRAELPDGWGPYSEVPNDQIVDRERTFCPAHAKNKT